MHVCVCVCVCWCDFLISPLSKMGYIDGKTDADLLIEEYDDEEMNEDIVIMEVKIVHVPYSTVQC